MGIDARILIRVKYKVTSNEARLFSLAIASSLGAKRFMINREKGLGAITILKGSIYEQDGESIEVEPNETLLEVNLWTRYYGVNYERGDLLLICAVAEWCEQNIENCEVWYGGDSSGVEMSPFRKETRDKLKSHLYSSKGRDYFHYKGSFARPDEKQLTPDISKCKLCLGEYEISRYGFGQNYAAWTCAGCGLKTVTNDGGLTWEKDKRDI